MKTFYYYLTILFFVPILAFSQGQGQKWFFGYNAGLDFTGGNPVAVTNGAINQWEGLATISDAAGNLLFYTNGQNVWNKNHVIMTNGLGLLGHNSSSQSAIIVPYPYYPDLYYIFAVDELGKANGVTYSIVDMSLSGGLGAVTSTKNMPLMSNSTEKITAVRHANNSDIWVVCHKWGSNQFQSFLIDACSGLNTTPVISNSGTVHSHTSGGDNTGAIGYMKASPRGNKLGLALYTQSSPSATNFELFDFNNTTGVVSNPLSLPSPSSTPLPPGIPWYRAYGVEFSPDGTYFYGGLNTTGEVFQYDLLAGGPLAIRNSARLVGTASAGSKVNIIGGLQLATDGKIYIARDDATWLASITNPNSSGAFFTNNAVSLAGKKSGLGLPTFIQSFFLDLPNIYIGYSGNACQGTPMNFALQGTDVPLVTSVDWDFGDGTTILNSSGSGVVSHTYTSSGVYFVQAKYYFGCYYVILGGNITVLSNPTVTANTTGSYCTNGGPVILSGSPSGGSWSGPGTIANVFFPALAGAGTHNLTYSYSNANGCTGTDVTSIIVNAAPVANITTTTTASCLTGGNISLTATNAGGTWTGPGVSGSVFSPSVAGVGSHTITYTTSNSGCTNSDTHTIVVNNNADATITNVAPLCANAAPVTLTAVSGGGTWSGPGVSGTTFDPSVAGVGVHTISYVIGGGCGASATKSITVYAVPNANFTPAGPYCTAGAPVTLAVTTAGGTFSGPGITGTTFNPAVAGVGSHSITYSVTNANNCTESTTKTIVVNNTPDATITSASTVCSADAPITLTANTGGGLWTGPGVSGGVFNPATVGVGVFTVTYTITGGCAATSSQAITVKATPNASFTASSSYCTADTAIVLVPTTAGGTFSGPGITGNVFNPSALGIGTYTIEYSVSTANGCSATTAQTITVNSTPDASITSASTLCSADLALTLTGVTPGGVWSGTGVTGNTFDPSVAGAGTHTVTHVSTTGNCSASASYEITVNQSPDATITSRGPYCPEDGEVQLTATTPGGIWSGVGILNDTLGTFDASMDTNFYMITYTITGICGAVDSALIQITTEVCDVETYVKIPNIFTPNGDGINDEFRIDASNIKTLYATILNRWGQVVYEWKGINGFWDGYTRSSQEASEGTYYYVIRGTDNNGGDFEHKGPLVLER